MERKMPLGSTAALTRTVPRQPLRDYRRGRRTGEKGTAATLFCFAVGDEDLRRCFPPPPSPKEEACSVTAHIRQAHYHMMPENGSCLLESFIVVRCRDGGQAAAFDSGNAPSAFDAAAVSEQLQRSCDEKALLDGNLHDGRG
nr:hypothetical protein Iba_chr12aCG13310 [Ipomoea batatas]